jgi:hypothetical protein
MKKSILMYHVVMLILVILLLAPACHREQEYPVVESWLSEGLIEKADFSSQRISSPGGSIKVFLVKAVVPSGTLADEGKAENLQYRLAADVPIAEDIDMVVVKLCEQQEAGWEWKVNRLPIAGRKRMDEQTWQLFLNQMGGCE